MQFGTSFLLVVVASLLIWGATAPSDSVADELDFSASIDTHFHVVSPQNWKNTRLAAMGVIDGPVDGDAALRLLDEAGLAKAVVISSAYLIPDATQAKSENDYIASLVKKNPDRFKGLCSVSVHHAGALEEFERCIDELGLSGLKMHGAADAIDLMNPEHLMLVDSYFKKAAELRKGLPVLIDFNWSDDAQTMAMFQLAMANQETTIILAHALGHHFAEFINVKILREALGQNLDNLYADVSATLTMYPPDAPAFENYMWHLRLFGTNRILLGSDYPAGTPKKTVEAFLKMGWTDEEAQMILSENAARIFR